MSENRNEILTHSGLRIPASQFKAKHIRLTDIIYGLAHVNRFSGQAGSLNVLGHSLRVHRYVQLNGGTIEQQLQALLHDAPEAYYNDIPSHIKHSCPAYIKAEAKLWRNICRKFRISSRLSPLIKEADDAVLKDEKFVRFDKRIDYWYPDNIQSRFKNIFLDLLEQHWFGGKPWTTT